MSVGKTRMTWGLTLGLLCACTKVQEAPPLPPPARAAAPTAAPTTAPKVRPRSPSSSFGSSSWGSSGWGKTETLSADEAESAPRDALKAPEPARPDKAALEAGLRNVMPGLASCLDGAKGTGPNVALEFEVDPSGKLGDVKAGGLDEGAARCIRNKLDAVRVPPFDGKAERVSFPLTVYERPAPAAPSKPAEPAPAAPPTFVQP